MAERLKTTLLPSAMESDEAYDLVCKHGRDLSRDERERAMSEVWVLMKRKSRPLKLADAAQVACERVRTTKRRKAHGTGCA